MPDPPLFDLRKAWPWRQAACKREILGVIQTIVDREISIVDGCWALEDLLVRTWPYYGDYGHPDFEVSAAVCRDTQHLPIGAVRKHWAEDSLRVKDQEIADIEDLYREDVLDWGRRMLESEGTKP